MSRTKIILGCIALWSLVLNTVAQDVQFTAYVDQNPVEVGDRFKLTFELTNTKGNITPPSLVDFQILFGPATSSSYQFVNGQTSSSLSYTYTLMAMKEGEYIIGAAKAETKEGEFTTKPIKLIVKKSSGQTQSSSNTARQKQQQQFQNNKRPNTNNQQIAVSGNQNIFVRIEMNKTNVYEGEEVKASYVLYSRYNAVELGEFETPSLTGFYSREVPSDNNSWDPNPVTINSMRYRRATLKEIILYPQAFGDIKIDPIDMTLTVNRSFFNPGSQVRIKSNSPKLKVKRLPSPQPGNFSGFTGKFNAKASVTTNSVAANEAINLKVNISGAGNLNLIPAPKINFPEDFEVYDPKINNKYKTTNGGTSGSKEFDYLIIPRYEGTYNIPAFEFVYFHPGKKKYVHEKMGPFTFHISKGTNTDQGASIVMSNKTDVQFLGKDIRYIKYETHLLPKNTAFFGSFLFWFLFAIPGLAILLSYLLLQRQRAEEKDVKGSKKRKANKLITKQLAQAKGLIGKDDKAFYEALFKGITQYMSDKLAINLAELTKERIKTELSSLQVNEQDILAIISVLDQCEMARFAPVFGVPQETLFEEVSQTINKINQQIK